MLKGKHVLIGVTGGIAIYKVLDLISRLVKEEAEVKVIMTESATKFVAPMAFECMSKNDVYVDMFELSQAKVHHIELAKWADVFLIAPATANTMAKLAHGIADNLLTSTALACTAPIAVAVAMNTNMLHNKATLANIDILRERGYKIIDSCSGMLACGDVGDGKMIESKDLLEHIRYMTTDKILLGRKIIVTAGCTVAPLDPVRYLTNKSTGKMGFEIARAAAMCGADVILVAGPTHLETPLNVVRLNVSTTENMRDAILQHYDTCECLIKAAAPLDYEPVEYSPIKIKKQEGIKSLELKRTIDIAGYFSEIKGNRIHVGFAAETDNVIEYAKSKMLKKKFDFIVANDVTDPSAGFGKDTNVVSIIDPVGKIHAYEVMSKTFLAEIIIDKVARLFDNRR